MPKTPQLWFTDVYSLFLAQTTYSHAPEVQAASAFSFSVQKAEVKEVTLLIAEK